MERDEGRVVWHVVTEWGMLEIKPNTDAASLKYVLPYPEYICMSESDKADVPPLHMMFVKGYTSAGFAEKVYHIHVRYTGDGHELYFKDYLTAHPEIAAEYAKIKQKLIKDYKYDRDGYTEAKGAFIKAITEKAREAKYDA